jgi:hypothetical protein
MDQTNAITNQSTEAKTLTPQEVLYAEKPKVDEVKTEEAKASADNTQEKTAEAKSEQAQGESKEEQKPLELKVPEGSHLTKAEVDEIVSFAKEQGLSQEAAQKLLEREHNAVDKFKTDNMKQFEQKREEWWKEVESDKELGGDNFKQTAENARRALEKFAPESLRKFLADSPYGNHPDLIRLFNNIGKAMQDDKLVLSGTQTAPSKSPIEILYDKTT